MTVPEITELIRAARSEKVQELSVGDVHVLFSSGAFAQAMPDLPRTVPEIEAALGKNTVSEDEAEALLDDPELFLHADGPPVVPQ